MVRRIIRGVALPPPKEGGEMNVDINFKIFQFRTWPWRKHETDFVAFADQKDAANLRDYLNDLEERIIKLEESQ